MAKTFEGFTASVDRPTYFDNITVEQVERLFVVYNSCSTASPDYKPKKKRRAKKADAEAEFGLAHQSRTLGMVTDDEFSDWSGDERTPFTQGFQDATMLWPAVSAPTAFAGGFEPSVEAFQPRAGGFDPSAPSFLDPPPGLSPGLSLNPLAPVWHPQ